MKEGTVNTYFVLFSVSFGSGYHSTKFEVDHSCIQREMGFVTCKVLMEKILFAFI